MDWLPAVVGFLLGFLVGVILLTAIYIAADNERQAERLEDKR